MRKIVFAGALLAAVAFQSLALAGGLPPNANPSCMWCGFYVGGNVGWASSTNRVMQNSIFPGFQLVDVAALNSVGSPALHSNGILGGAQTGYNWEFGNAVFGVEADFDFPSIKATQAGTFVFPSTLPGGAVGPPTAFFNATTTVSTDWLVTLRPRVGWAIDNWLLYGTGGLAVARENLSQSFTLLTPFVLSNSFTTTQVGWTAGAGVEAKLSRNWSVKAEYLYVDLGNTPTNASVLTPPLAGNGGFAAMHLTANVVRVGLDYHFDNVFAPF